MVAEQIVLKELEKLSPKERIRKLRELEEQRKKEIADLEKQIQESILDLKTEETKTADIIRESQKRKPAEEAAPALEETVEKTSAPPLPQGTVQYGRPLEQIADQIGKLYSNIKELRQEIEKKEAAGVPLTGGDEGKVQYLQEKLRAVKKQEVYETQASQQRGHLIILAEDMLNRTKYKINKLEDQTLF